MPWTLRLKSPGDIEKKCYFDDMIKGKIEMPENVIDVVLLKTDGIPTYHFAHAIDDHLMRTTHVTRGDEWIASVPLHLQLFKVLGFKPVKYAHVAPIMKEENGGKRKLSKRKDPESAVSYYSEVGYPAASVNEYMMTILNSNFEDWRRANQNASIYDFPFNLKKMSASGALFDFVKLTDISKNVISKMSAEEVFELSNTWAKEYDEKLAALYAEDEQYAKDILNIDRENKKPRKDLAKWSDIPDYISYMYDETFTPCYELCGNATNELAKNVLEKYIDENSTVLDIGCGSGILSIASLLLGAKSAFGVDIDSLAVKTAQANALENGFDESKFKAVQGNLSDKVSGKYNVVVANIVADIIMEFNKEVGKYLENDGVYITGGIIESREDEVLLSFAQNGFEVKERFEEKGWLVFVVKKSK